MKKQISKKDNRAIVTFSLPAEAVDGAKEVLLLGDFNDWNLAMPFEMKRQKDGSFQKKVELPIGSDYQFRYFIDHDHWENDWHADRYQPSALYPQVQNSVVCLQLADNDVDGIGPKIEALLNKAGICTYQQLAITPINELDAILQADDSMLSLNHAPSSWQQQAALASEGKWEALKSLQLKLNNGAF